MPVIFYYMHKHYLSVLIIFIVIAPISVFSQVKYTAKFTQTAPVIDGLSTDTCWSSATWYSIDQLWLGVQPTATDFTGRFKICWDANKIYVLGEITDDSLSDVTSDSLVRYWEDDTFEIFVDENRSGGNHQNNYNAMAYHISKYFDVVDIDSIDQSPHTYPSALNVARTRNGNVYTWEVAMNVYTDVYSRSVANNPKANLVNDKILGFAVAYCDNDGDSSRDSFIGSEVIAASDKNVAYKDASVFGALQLKGGNISAVTEDNKIISNSLAFYPNPANDKIFVDNGVSVRIFDFSGMEVLVDNGSNSISIASLPQGIYLVELVKGDKVVRKKLVKE